MGVSFIVAATRLTDVVTDYLLQQRTREDTQLTEQLAETVAAPFQQAASEEVNRQLAAGADAMNGRLLLLDADGKVQYDTFQALCGQRLQLREVLRVLTAGETGAYGSYSPGRAVVEEMSGEPGADYLAYCTHVLTYGGRRLGLVLFVSRIQAVMDSVSSVRWQLLSVFLVVALGALALALLLSQVLTKPITALSRTMSKMGKGDLSVRVPVRGTGELRELAENYNTMAEQLETLDKTRNQFVSNASHELKTPLTTMKIMLESLIYQPDMPPDVRQEFMQDMNHEIDRLTGIISDLLTLTRLDSGENAVTETVNLTEVTEETLRQLQPAAENRNQVLTSSVAPDLLLTGDRIKLSQILYNLLDNAIKYTPEGGRISVTLTGDEKALVWRVEDNGIGIPQEDQKHIFERFYRVDKARSRDTGGTGLGLSIVRQLVKLEGGDIRVDSEPGRGSRFTVTFPRTEPDQKG